MNFLLPRTTSDLSAMDRLVLDTVRAATRQCQGISPRGMVGIGLIDQVTMDLQMESLACRGHILLTMSHVACLSQVRTELKKERDKNRNRIKRNTAPVWDYRKRLGASFPGVVQKTQAARPDGYRVPTAFKPLIDDTERKSAHRKNRPADVEEFAGPYYPGDLHALLQVEEEQKAAHREVWILFTRKAAYLGVRRKRHTPT